MVARAKAGQQRRPAQGRRPVRLRPRRRGGRGAARGRRRRSRSSRGHRRASRRPPTRASPSPTATTPPRSPSSPATRTRRRTSRRSTGRRWRAFPGTLVLYMGVEPRGEIAARPDRGRARRRPSRRRRSSAERCPASGPSRPRSRTSPPRSTEAGLRPPAILLVGAVAARRDAIAWLERRPLHGTRVVVTRARAQASGMARPLAALGADVVELPAIRIEPRTRLRRGPRGRRRASTPTRSSA